MKNIIIISIIIILAIAIYFSGILTQDSNINDSIVNDDVSTQSSEEYFASGIITSIDFDSGIIDYSFKYRESQDSDEEIEALSKVKVLDDAKVYSAKDTVSFNKKDLNEITLNDIEVGQIIFFKIDLDDSALQDIEDSITESDKFIVILSDIILIK